MSSVRARLAVDAEAQYDKISSTLIKALDSTKKSWGFCPACRKKVQIDHPDHGAQLKAAEMLLEQGFGRPGADTSGRSPEAVGAEVTLAMLEDMSLTQLAAHVWATTSDEQRELQRRFAEEVEAHSWPPGFAEALMELRELAEQHEWTGAAG